MVKISVQLTPKTSCRKVRKVWKIIVIDSQAMARASLEGLKQQLHGGDDGCPDRGECLLQPLQEYLERGLNHRPSGGYRIPESLAVIPEQHNGRCDPGDGRHSDPGRASEEGHHTGQDQ